jgi:hypothetical protein
MNTSELFERALARLRRGGSAAGQVALAGGVLLQLPALTACVDTEQTDAAEQADWAQYEGIRNTEMVSYTGSYWSKCNAPNTRFGCGSVDIWVKLRVRPVAGADIAWKRVGVVYKNAADLTERTAIGNYFTTYANGDEEWHVPMSVPAFQTTVLFDGWYQDGTGETWVDDNQGELHVINDGPSYQVVRVEPWLNTVTVGASGVLGRISVQAYDLDYDKQIKLVGTTDGWATQFELPLTWSEDLQFGTRERWTVDIDRPGATGAFEYAVVYRHGIVNGAREYDFWDNNFGQNYRVEPVVN